MQVRTDGHTNRHKQTQTHAHTSAQDLATSHCFNGCTVILPSFRPFVLQDWTMKLWTTKPPHGHPPETLVPQFLDAHPSLHSNHVFLTFSNYKRPQIEEGNVNPSRFPNFVSERLWMLVGRIHVFLNSLPFRLYIFFRLLEFTIQ
jgi:hypothetical protein